MTVTCTKSNSASAYFCPPEVSRDSWAGTVLPKNRTCIYHLGWSSLDKPFGRELKLHGQSRKKAEKLWFLGQLWLSLWVFKTLLLSSSCLPAVKPQAELPQFTVNPTYLHKQGLVVKQIRRLCWNVLGPLQSTHKKNASVHLEYDQMNDHLFSEGLFSPNIVHSHLSQWTCEIVSIWHFRAGLCWFSIYFQSSHLFTQQHH